MKKETGNYIEMSYIDMKNRSLDYCLTSTNHICVVPYNCNKVWSIQCYECTCIFALIIWHTYSIRGE